MTISAWQGPYAADLCDAHRRPTKTARDREVAAARAAMRDAAIEELAEYEKPPRAYLWQGRAINDIPALTAALRAVLDLHREVQIYAHIDECGHAEDAHDVVSSFRYGYLCADSPTGISHCATCRDDSGLRVHYPCPTITTITGHLETP